MGGAAEVGVDEGLSLENVVSLSIILGVSHHGDTYDSVYMSMDFSVIASQP